MRCMWRLGTGAGLHRCDFGVGFGNSGSDVHRIRSFNQSITSEKKAKREDRETRQSVQPTRRTALYKKGSRQLICSPNGGRRQPKRARTAWPRQHNDLARLPSRSSTPLCQSNQACLIRGLHRGPCPPCPSPSSVRSKTRREPVSRTEHSIAVQSAVDERGRRSTSAACWALERPHSIGAAGTDAPSRLEGVGQERKE